MQQKKDLPDTRFRNKNQRTVWTFKNQLKEAGKFLKKNHALSKSVSTSQEVNWCFVVTWKIKRTILHTKLIAFPHDLDLWLLNTFNAVDRFSQTQKPNFFPCVFSLNLPQRRGSWYSFHIWYPQIWKIFMFFGIEYSNNIVQWYKE